MELTRWTKMEIYKEIRREYSRNLYSDNDEHRTRWQMKNAVRYRMRKFNLTDQEAYELYKRDTPRKRMKRKKKDENSEEKKPEVHFNSQVVDRIVVWLESSVF